MITTTTPTHIIIYIIEYVSYHNFISFIRTCKKINILKNNDKYRKIKYEHNLFNYKFKKLNEKTKYLFDKNDTKMFIAYYYDLNEIINAIDDKIVKNPCGLKSFFNHNSYNIDELTIDELNIVSGNINRASRYIGEYKKSKEQLLKLVCYCRKNCVEIIEMVIDKYHIKIDDKMRTFICDNAVLCNNIVLFKKYEHDKLNYDEYYHSSCLFLNLEILEHILKHKINKINSYKDMIMPFDMENTKNMKKINKYVDIFIKYGMIYVENRMRRDYNYISPIELIIRVIIAEKLKDEMYIKFIQKYHSHIWRYRDTYELDKFVACVKIMSRATIIPVHTKIYELIRGLIIKPNIFVFAFIFMNLIFPMILHYYASNGGLTFQNFVCICGVLYVIYEPLMLFIFVLF